MRKINKALSLVLAAVMLVCILPIYAGAVSENDVIIDFSKTTTVSEYGPDDITPVGYELVKSKCPTYTWTIRKQTDDALGVSTYLSDSGMVLATAWPESTSQRLMFTISTNIPASGYYGVEMLGSCFIKGAVYSVYVGGKYAGDYNCYDETASSFTTGESKKLNTIYLEAGSNEISFKCIKLIYNQPKNGGVTYSAWLGVNKITLSYLGTDVGALDRVEAVTAIPDSMAVGDEFVGEAAAYDANNGVRYFADYAEDGTADTADAVSVKSSNPSVIEVSDVKTGGMNESDKISYKLTAKKGGNADITISATVDGTEKDFVKTITVSSEKEELPENVSLLVSAEGAGSETVDFGGYNTSQVYGNIAFGSRIELTAPELDGYKFRYWRVNGIFVNATGNSYSFDIFSNTRITAVYEKTAAENANVFVEFLNGNGAFVDKKEVAKGTLFSDIEKPASEPTLTGFKFIGWTLSGIDGSAVSDDTAVNTNSVAVAEYGEDNSVSELVSIDGETASAYGYSEAVNASRTGTTYWTRGGKTVAYGENYTYYAWNGTSEIVSHTDSVEKVPVIVLDDTPLNGARMIEYDVPDGYTKLEAGILFGSNDSTITSFSSKAVLKNTLAHGQFTAQPYDSSDAGRARGYLIYKDSSGATHIIYSE